MDQKMNSIEATDVAAAADPVIHALSHRRHRGGVVRAGFVDSRGLEAMRLHTNTQFLSDLSACWKVEDTKTSGWSIS